MKENNLKNARILIVDDQELNTELLETLLEDEGYTNYKSTTDPREVLPLYAKFQPDLILLDLMMPYLDGYAVMQQIGPRIPEGDYLPILVLTGEASPEAKKKALSMGAKDFLAKPLDSTEALLRVKNLLETRFLHLRLQNQNQVLEEKVREQPQEVDDARNEILMRLAVASEYREDPTGEHPKRVGETSAILARASGLTKAQVELIRLAAPLHDVGKIGVADAILRKREPLNAEEFEQMKMHTALGARILSGTQIPVLQLAEEIALYHHEHWDGSGYAGIAGANIPVAARIVAIADAFDTLTHAGPHRPARPVRDALAELAQQSGRRFEPRLVDAFLRWHRRQELPTKMRETILAG